METEHALSHADNHVFFEETKVSFSESAYYSQLHMESVEVFKHGFVAMNRKEKPSY